MRMASFLPHGHVTGRAEFDSFLREERRGMLGDDRVQCRGAALEVITSELRQFTGCPPAELVAHALRNLLQYRAQHCLGFVWFVRLFAKVAKQQQPSVTGLNL